MKPSQHFLRAFFYFFVFYIVAKNVQRLLIGDEEFNTAFILRTLVVGFVGALILGIINYFVKFDFSQKK